MHRKVRARARTHDASHLPETFISSKAGCRERGVRVWGGGKSQGLHYSCYLHSGPPQTCVHISCIFLLHPFILPAAPNLSKSLAKFTNHVMYREAGGQEGLGRKARETRDGGDKQQNVEFLCQAKGHHPGKAYLCC